MTPLEVQLEVVVHSEKVRPSMSVLWVSVGEVVLNEGLLSVMVMMLPEGSVVVLANTVEVEPDESVVVMVHSVTEMLSTVVLHSVVVEVTPLLLVVVPIHSVTVSVEPPEVVMVPVLAEGVLVNDESDDEMVETMPVESVVVLKVSVEDSVTPWLVQVTVVTHSITVLSSMVVDQTLVGDELLKVGSDEEMVIVSVPVTPLELVVVVVRVSSVTSTVSVVVEVTPLELVVVKVSVVEVIHSE